MTADLSMNTQNDFDNKNILLVISGGIAAYKSLDLIRRMREQGAIVRCILTKGGSQFVTPLSIAALSENAVYQDLWSLTDEQEMGHIRLVREADLIIVAPASANMLAKLAHGLADDLASTALLAATTPILLAPAMNGAMWSNAATQANITTLRHRGFHLVEPAHGLMACGETGTGRLADGGDILLAAATLLSSPIHFPPQDTLRGLHALVTSGPTQEPIDPARYISNHSSGKQGHAIAAALAAQGARVTLITGPVTLPVPANVTTSAVTTARDMLAACESALPADIFIGCAAVADWHVTNATSEKMKKESGTPQLSFAPNPDILSTIAHHTKRPRLVIGFAAETNNLTENATAKIKRKGCDWLLANDVSHGKVFGTDNNEIVFLQKDPNGTITATPWPRQSKNAVAAQLVATITTHFRSLP